MKKSVVFDHTKVLQWELQSYGESFDDGYILLKQELQEWPSYLIDTWHCINSNCDCTDLCINFLEINLSDNSVIGSHVIVEYETTTAERFIGQQNKDVDVEKLMNMLTKLINECWYDLQDVFSKRQEYFKEVYWNYIQKNKETLQWFTDAVVYLNKTCGEDDMFMENIVITDLHSAPKAWRNKPCPCGSGKKYKKCCLKTS